MSFASATMKSPKKFVVKNDLNDLNNLNNLNNLMVICPGPLNTLEGLRRKDMEVEQWNSGRIVAVEVRGIVEPVLQWKFVEFKAF